MLPAIVNEKEREIGEKVVYAGVHDTLGRTVMWRNPKPETRNPNE